MKIYNKKSFASGCFMVLLGNLNLVMDLLNHRFETKGVILTIALCVMGVGTIIRSLSRKLAREDKLDEMDERNQLIALKSKSKAFRLTQTISFLLMLGLLAIGKVSGYVGFITMGVGLAFAFSISMFTEIFTSMYYETKN